MKNVITAADVNEKNIENKVKAELKKYIEQKTKFFKKYQTMNQQKNTNKIIENL